MIKTAYNNLKLPLLLVLYFTVFVVFGFAMTESFGERSVYLFALIQALLWVFYSITLPVKVRDSLNKEKTLQSALEFSFVPVVVCLMCTLLGIVFFGPSPRVGLVTVIGGIGCSSGIALAMFLVFSPIIQNIKKGRKELEEANAHLKEALQQKKALSGLIPVCAYCKRIRDDQGFWNQLENYIEENTDTLIAPFLCPECEPKPYKR